jgi:ankyrin repeat protein
MTTAPANREEIAVIHAAAHQGRTDIINAIVSELADHGASLMDIGAILSAPRQLDGSTPLHVAAMQGHVDVCRALLHVGVNVVRSGTSGSVQGKTPFDIAKGPVRQVLLNGGPRRGLRGMTLVVHL